MDQNPIEQVPENVPEVQSQDSVGEREEQDVPAAKRTKFGSRIAGGGRSAVWDHFEYDKKLDKSKCKLTVLLNLISWVMCYMYKLYSYVATQKYTNSYTNGEIFVYVYTQTQTQMGSYTNTHTQTQTQTGSGKNMHTQTHTQTDF